MRCLCYAGILSTGWLLLTLSPYLLKWRYFFAPGKMYTRCLPFTSFDCSGCVCLDGSLVHDSDDRPRNISVENAKLNEEVEVLKKEQERLRGLSALQLEKESLKQRQDIPTKGQNILRHGQDRVTSLLRSELQELRKNVTTEQKDLEDKLLRNQRSMLDDVTQAKLTLTKLEKRFNTSERQLSMNTSQTQQVRLFIFVFAAVADGFWRNKT